MEDARSQLETLIVKAKKQGIDLEKLPALKKRENLLQLHRKIKVVLAVAFFGIVVYQLKDLFGGEKVKNNTSFKITNKLPFFVISVLFCSAKRLRQDIQEAQRLQLLRRNFIRNSNFQNRPR